MPFIVRWPGKVPAGRVDQRTVFTAVDLFPTLAGFAGATPARDMKLEGVDVAAVWRGEVGPPRGPLFWEYGRNDEFFKFGPDRSPNIAVRRDHWKLLVNADGSKPELYDLATDPKEAKNLIAAQPDLARELTKLALDWRGSLPKRN